VLTPFPAVDAPAASMKRLTADQYRNAITDVLGAGLALPATLEPDSPSAGLRAVGASRTTISSWGVEQYESAAYGIAAQVLDDEARRGSLVPCTPAGTVDDACARSFVERIGLRLYRRPLAEDELARLTGIAAEAATALSSFDDGLAFALAAMLQSPSFLFRMELGTAGAYDGYEMASRLSFFLWNTTPDDELLAAAASGALATDDGLAKEARRLIDSERSKAGVRQFFSDMLELYELDDLRKDPTVFVHFSTELGADAREETLLDIERIVFDLDTDYRKLFTLEETHVNRPLAALYSVRAPAKEGFGLVALPPAGGRRGLFGHASFLALHSHPAASSAVQRGQFIRKVILCHTIPPPPVDVNTALPEPSPTARTLRERNVIHLENPTCAGCHRLMDPIGLGFEIFDGIGRYRTMDNGGAIDASGELDGVAFASPWELGQVVHDHPDVPACLAKTMYQYATANEVTDGERELVRVLGERFAASGYRVKALLFDVVTSPGFRRAEGVN
jgi:hypothetical protein